MRRSGEGVAAGDMEDGRQIESELATVLKLPAARKRQMSSQRAPRKSACIRVSAEVEVIVADVDVAVLEVVDSVVLVDALIGPDP